MSFWLPEDCLSQLDPFIFGLSLEATILTITALNFDPLLFQRGPCEENVELSIQRWSHYLLYNVAKLSTLLVSLGFCNLFDRHVLLKLLVDRSNLERLGHDCCEKLARSHILI